jgi:hypothetical protein
VSVFSQEVPQILNTIGQNVVFNTYSASSFTIGINASLTTSVDVRLEGSTDGVNFFKIVDDFTLYVTDTYGYAFQRLSLYQLRVTLLNGSGTLTISVSRPTGGS